LSLSNRKLADEAVDCLVELESDKLMIAETFANISYGALGIEDEGKSSVVSVVQHKVIKLYNTFRPSLSSCRY
jgi:hypothetical protein